MIRVYIFLEIDPKDKKIVVYVNKLNKKFGNSTAVNQVSFGLEYGECFALLGVTGAGKTTTFKCLTGEEKPTNGRVFINGYDVTKPDDWEEARR